MRRRIEITTTERVRVLTGPGWILCPVCQSPGEMLTTAQAAALAQVNIQSVRRWLSQGHAHGVKTCGGHHRVCKNSLFKVHKELKS
jgi:hydrogenase maturation factor HypF (carbamoyltransferase family)